MAGGKHASAVTEKATSASLLSGKQSNLIVTIIASMLIITASFVNFLQFNGYPLMKSEVGLVGIGLLFVTIVMGLLYHRQRYLGKGLLEGLLVFIVLDQNGAPPVYAIIGGIIICTIVFFRTRSVLPFLGMVALVTLITSLAGIGAKPVNPPQISENSRANPTGHKSTLPALFHIILDEHIGIEGLPSDNPETAAMKEKLKSFYLSRNFRLYGRAYSEHFHTVNSIPQMLNFGETQPSGENPKDGGQIRKNAYFDRLEKIGYRLHINQSSFLDFCHNREIERCRQYDYARFGSIARSSLTVTERAGIIAVRFALLSSAVEPFNQAYTILAAQLVQFGYKLPDFGLLLAGKVSTVNALFAFDTLIEDLKQAQPGDAYVSHMLLPHYPYATTKKCQLRNVDKWVLRRAVNKWVQLRSNLSIKQREDAYFDQLECATNKLDAALTALSRSPAGNNFIVIVHGDHGSRITKTEPTIENMGRFEESDTIAGFSTILAVRGPGIAAGYEQSPVTVAQILSQLSNSQFRKTPEVKTPQQPTVILDNRRWTPQKPHPLPVVW